MKKFVLQIVVPHNWDYKFLYSHLLLWQYTFFDLMEKAMFEFTAGRTSESCAKMQDFTWSPLKNEVSAACTVLWEKRNEKYKQPHICHVRAAIALHRNRVLKLSIKYIDVQLFFYRTSPCQQTPVITDLELSLHCICFFRSRLQMLMTTPHISQYSKRNKEKLPARTPRA